MAQIGPRIKSTQNLLKFATFDISNIAVLILMSKIIFIKYLPPVWHKYPKIKSAQNLLKFGTFDISNMLILILMSKMIFMKYLLLGPNWPLKLKMFRIYWNLAHLIFRISWSRFLCQKLFSLNTYHFFGPNWSENQNCSGFNEIWFWWNIYQLLGQINAKIKTTLKFMFHISSIPILTTISDKRC